MSEPIVFEVVGVPAPQGSHTAISRGGKPALIPAGTKTSRLAHRDWRVAVAEAARDAAPADGPLDGPLAIWVTFRFPLPSSRSAVVKRTGWAWKATKPDLDKLARSTCDGLVVGGLIRDDSRIVELHLQKVEVDAWSGAEIHVEPCRGDWR